MRVWFWSAKRVKRVALLWLCLAAGAILLRYPQAASNGVANGLAVCGKLLVPSLFPFLVLTGFLIQSGSLAPIERALAWCCRTLVKAPCPILPLWLISVLGGYPAGAVAIHEQLARGAIDPRTARSYLGACVHAGPAFVIGGVGVGMLGSRQAGLLLLSAHLLSSVLTAWLYREQVTPCPTVPAPPVPLGKAVTSSLHQATATLIGMAGCVLAACCVLSVVDATGVGAVGGPCLRAGWVSLLEVTSGCMQAAATGVHAPFFIGWSLGFGGLSVIGQIAAVGETSLLTRRFLMMRITHGLLGGCLSLLLFRFFPPQDLAVKAAVALSDTSLSPLLGVSGTLLLMIMGVLFLATLPREQLSNSRITSVSSL